MRKIIIFIDGLPYYHKNICEEILNAKSRELKTGLGFSSNQHCLLLKGKTPDEVNFFTDWTLNRNINKTGYYLNHNNVIGYVLNKALGKIQGYTHSIPIGLHKCFQQSNIYPLKNKSSITNYNEEFKKFDFFIDDEVEELFKSKSILKQDSILVINKIDHNGHYLGPRSKKYLESLIDLLQNLKLLIQRNGGTYILFSDHGMSDKPKPFKINLEKEFGQQGNSRYFYFIDSTSIKIWVFENKLKTKIKEYLENIKEGILLNEDNRKEYGVVNKDFGDLIFILKNDWYFKNTYFGRGWKSKTLGMHGNWPKHKQQSGIVISDYEDNKESIDSSDFYTQIMQQFLGK